MELVLHLASAGYRIQAFYSLLTEDAKELSGGVEYVHLYRHLQKNKKPVVLKTSCGGKNQRSFDPNDAGRVVQVGKREGRIYDVPKIKTRFACAIHGTKRKIQ